MKKEIPKAKYIEPSSHIPKQTQIADSDVISFSFQTLDFNEYFNLDGTCKNWSTELFEMLKDISKIPKLDLLQGKYRTYRVHPDGSATAPVPLPNNIELESMHQIRIGKSKGGIHGIFIGSVFYIVWLDPLHNLYPDKRFGLRKIKPGSTCCKDRDQELLDLMDEISRLESEIKTYDELLSEKCDSNSSN